LRQKLYSIITNDQGRREAQRGPGITVAVLSPGRRGAPPVLIRTPGFVAIHDFLLQRQHKYLISLRFQSVEQWVNLRAAFVVRPKTKYALALGGLRPPDPLNRDSAPGSRWGLCPQTPFIGSRYGSPWGRAHQILRARTATAGGTFLRGPFSE